MIKVLIIIWVAMVVAPITVATSMVIKHKKGKENE